MPHHRILVIDDKIPDPHFGAGFPRAYRLLLSMIELGHQIVFFPNIRQTVPSLDLMLLKSYGIEVITDMDQLPHDVDLIVVSRPHNAHYHMPEAKKRLSHAKVIYDTEALWYRRYDLQLEITGKLPQWAYRYDELGLARQVDLCFVVNDIERKILLDGGAKRVIKLAHALDIHEKGLPFEQRSNVLVVGGKLEEDSSNEDGLWVYLENCWNQVCERTNTDMNITGQVTSPRLLKHSFQRVNIMGHVDNLVPLYESHRIFVAATRFSTGIPWKVHEAMAHGTPCVISKLLADQLELVWDEEAMVATNYDEFVKKSVALYTQPDLWNKVRNKGFNLIKRDCDPDHFKVILQSTIDELFA